MKPLKLIIVFILTVAAIVAVLSWVLPASQTVEKSVTIHASSEKVYQYLSRLENFHRFSVWSLNDSAIVHTLSGTDGTVGAVSTWKGNPALSGEGKIEISALNPKSRIEHRIIFLRPEKAEAHSFFTLAEANNHTTLIWKFRLLTPRPRNIFNLLSNLDKKMGKDFEQGLANLKKLLEENGTGKAEKNYEVKEMNFPATTFAAHRQVVGIHEVQLFFAQHLPHIFTELNKAGIKPGIPTGIYYTWDEPKGQADMAAALPVSSGTAVSDTSINIIHLPASKAVFVDYYGAYENMATAHNSIEKYFTTKKLKQKPPVLEMFITDPGQEKDTARWLTKIIYLVH
jgi:effector-binding domain-containing protein/uncharacterized protein YndB with AHSA1/START domain